MIDLIEIDIRGSAKTFTASHSIIMKMITGAKLCLMYYNHPNVHPELQRLKKPKKNCVATISYFFIPLTELLGISDVYTVWR